MKKVFLLGAMVCALGMMADFREKVFNICKI